jgi:hypothetical protein
LTLCDVWCGVGSTYISYMRYFRFSLGYGMVLDLFFSGRYSQSLSDHFLQFTYLAGSLCARRSSPQLVWLACGWVVWNERNHLRVFRNAANVTHQLINKLKLFSYWWLRVTDITLASSLHC